MKKLLLFITSIITVVTLTACSSSSTKSKLQELIPEASIGFVHGQMSEIRLENTLLDFIEGEYDIE